MHLLHGARMLCAGRNKVNTGRLDRAVPQNIRQLDHVMTYMKKGPCKEVAQIMGKHFFRRDPRLPAKAFHLRPKLLPGQPPSASGKKNFTGSVFLRPRIGQQLPAEYLGN